MKRLLLVASLAIGVASVVAACGGSGTPSDFGSGDDGGGGDDAADGGGVGDDGSLFDTNFGSDTSACAARHCSSDLHQVLDCNDAVVTTCPGDQGCAAGACVAACDAAKANKSTVGCDYFAYVPDAYSADNGDCYAAFIANTWGSPISITVDRGGQTFNAADFARIPSGSGQATTYGMLPNGQIPPGQVAIVFLAGTSSAPVKCPSGITPAFSASDAATHGTGIGTAFHVKTSAPVVAYDIYPYGGGNSAATSATLLLPTSAWDTNYVGVDAFRKSVIVSSAQPFIEVVGTVNATNVTVRPVVAITGGAGVAATPANTPRSYVVAAGQVLQFTQDAELAGSAISADQPIGLWGGATCLSIDVNTAACDSAHQNIPPVKALGNRYVAVRYRNRFAGMEETVPWRMVGGVDGTTLTYSPSTPPGAPTSLALGQVAEFQSPGQFVVQSQDADHPFYMSAHMTGCQTTNPAEDDCRGDPEFVNIIPPEQYLAKYTFFTDPTYPETNLVLMRERKNGAFADVTVDCAGTVGGWTPIDTADTIEYTRLDLVTGNFSPVGNCNNGLHIAQSALPFGLVVWGWGSAASGAFSSQAVSYAYPAGASVKPINTVVIQ